MGIRDILEEAGQLLKARYRETPRFSEKARFELVAETDQEIEQLLVRRLQAAFPDDSLYGEESGAVGKPGNARWIIDPIDGTANFIAGVPYFAISLAREIDGAIVEGYVYNPVSEEFYHATSAARESYLNGVPIRASACSEISHALVAFGFSANMSNIKKYYAQWQHVFDGCKKGLPLIVPSLTLCNVARGRLDAFIDFGCSMEGQAAASLILRNAGGAVLDYDMTAYDHRTHGIVAAAAGLMDALRAARGNES